MLGQNRSFQVSVLPLRTKNQFLSCIFWHLLHIFRCDHIHTCPCNIFSQAHPRCAPGNLTSTFFNALTQSNIFLSEYLLLSLQENHCFTSAGDPYRRVTILVELSLPSSHGYHRAYRYSLTLTTSPFSILQSADSPSDNRYRLNFSSIDIPPFYSCSIFTVIVFKSGYCKSCSFVSLISSISPVPQPDVFRMTLSSSK